MPNKITFKTLPDFSREVTCPNGLKVIETLKHRQALRADLVAMIAEQTRQIADIDALEATIAAEIAEVRR